MINSNGTIAAAFVAALTLGGAFLLSAAPAVARGVPEYVPRASQAWGYYRAPSNSLSDTIRSFEGTPCGINCTRQSQAHDWGVMQH